MNDAENTPGKNALRELFSQFEATAGSSEAMWEFYDSLSTPLKILIWEQHPQHHATLREEERKQEEANG